MKKFISVFTAAVVAACGFTSCADGAASTGGSDDSISIVTTIFPEYDWVQNVLGDNPGNAEVTMLLDNGVDLHSYQPTSQDILKIATCDLFIYVGGESDEWVEDALEEAVNEDMIVIDLLDVLGDSVKEEELVEGMEGEEEEEESESEEEGPEYDEHVWLSLRNASTIVGEIASALAQIDEANADAYLANAEAYQNELNDLDSRYQEAVNSSRLNTVLFGDRFPFRYLVDDYGLSYYAAFVGCSAETEASFETIIFLAGKVDELSLSTILTIEGNDHSIAETIRDNTETKDQQILTMDSMQSTTSQDAANGVTYISIMESNLEVLTEALN
ncbi:MAG: metal ABC transporter substrate-binding protein [Saccharofermentans sp.]|nr:metal ABC transporter substrate-binding protein [Saccharofermentans sp.]